MFRNIEIISPCINKTQAKDVNDKLEINILPFHEHKNPLVSKKNIIQIHIFASILELREILCLFVVNLSNYLNILFLLNRSFSKGSIDGTFVRKLKRKQVEKLNFSF